MAARSRQLACGLDSPPDVAKSLLIGPSCERSGHSAEEGPDIPVLIVWPEFDSVFRQQDRDTEDRYWHEYCGCDVTSWTAPGAGHPFQVYRSMPAVTDEVVTWIHSKGL